MLRPANASENHRVSRYGIVLHGPDALARLLCQDLGYTPPSSRHPREALPNEIPVIVTVITSGMTVTARTPTYAKVRNDPPEALGAIPEREQGQRAEEVPMRNRPPQRAVQSAAW